MTISLPSLSKAVTPTADSNSAPAAKEEAAIARAKEFEAVFIAQMLKHTGLEKAISADSGYAGEGFASMLLEQFAEKLVEKGGFGLADQIYDSLKTKDAAHGTDTTA